MKKILSLVCAAMLFAGTFALQSCNKCTTCTYTYEVLGQTQSYTYPELCGNKTDIDDYENACANAAALVGSNCSCN